MKKATKKPMPKGKGKEKTCPTCGQKC